MAGRIWPWVIGFLAVSYLIGAPVMMAVEALQAGPSQRFGYAPAFIHLVGVLQVAGGLGLLWPRVRRLAAMGLAAVMVGAAFTHVQRGAPLAALPACLYFALLVWVARRRAPYSPNSSAKLPE